MRKPKKQPEKWHKEYKHKLKVIGAMELYGLDRETAEQLSKDIEEIISQVRQQAIRETLEKVKLEEKEVEITRVSPRNFDYNQAVDDLTNLKNKLKEA